MRMKFLAFALFVTSYSMSQQLPKEVVVRFNLNYLNLQAIDNEGIIEASVMDFMNNEGRKQVERIQQSGFDMGKVKAKKMFPHLHTRDSISISRLGKLVNMPPFWATLLLEVPEGMKYWEFHREIKKHNPLIVYADPPLIGNYMNIPDDTLFLDQFSLYDPSNPDQTINLDSVWNIETGKRHIKVGVHDSGIDAKHEDLKVLTGYAYYDDIDIDSLGQQIHLFGTDGNGHGTGVAGIIGARRNNTTGISGIAGGDGIDTSGVSLIDFALGSISNGNHVAMSIIDAARYVGTYKDWNGNSGEAPPTNEHYWDQAVGYGIHIGNHSYGLETLADPDKEDQRTIPNTDTSTWNPIIPIPKCNLCREAHLFSLQNGVVNVVARGNNQTPFDLNNPGGDNLFPQNFDDTWIVTVGASGTDGKRLHAIGNTDVGEHWYSPIGKNIDVIAPGSRASVGTTRSYNYPNNDSIGRYRRFNGTSASAPHVSGVAALLMSYWNKPCYSNINLDPADVEYILQKSATDVNPNVFGYDDSTGYGRLNAYEAIKMIQFPKYQIVHPEETFVTSQEIEIDTITLFVDEPINVDYNGPLSNGFPIQQPFLNAHYRVERIKQELTYNFANYRTTSNELLDIWFRPSETNSLGFVADTFTNLNVPPQQVPPVIADEFKIAPKAKVLSFTDTTVTLQGFFYHFIGRHSIKEDVLSSLIPEDFWYPINPNTTEPRMAYSIYLKDTLAVDRWDFPCDTITALYDSLLNTQTIDIYDFSIFPNPAHTTLNVQLESQNKGVIEVYSITGELIDKVAVQPHKSLYQLSVARLSKGLYFVTYRSGQVTRSKKWIKQ